MTGRLRAPKTAGAASHPKRRDRERGPWSAVEGLLARPPGEKTLFLMGVNLATNLVWIPIVFFNAPGFEAMPEVRHETLNRIVTFFPAVVAGFALLFFAGFLVRKSGRWGVFYTYVCFFYYGCFFFSAIHMIGTLSTPGLILYLGLPPLVLLLYGPREGLVSMGSMTVLLLALATGEFLGWIPYAPLLKPEYTRFYLRPQVFWLIVTAALSLAILVFALVWLVRSQLVEREGALGRTRASLGAVQDRLAQAGQALASGELLAGALTEVQARLRHAGAAVESLIEHLPRQSDGRDLERMREDLRQVAEDQGRASSLAAGAARLVQAGAEEMETVNLNALVSDSFSRTWKEEGGPANAQIDLAARRPSVRAYRIELLWALDRILEQALPAAREAPVRLSTRDEAGSAVFRCTFSAANGWKSGEGLGMVHRVAARHSGQIVVAQTPEGQVTIDLALPVLD